jgi:hypothetical protein
MKGKGMFNQFFRFNFAILSWLIFMMTGSLVYASSISNEMKDKQNIYKSERNEMKKELKTLLGNLKDANNEEKRSTVEDWKENNRERILAQKQLGKEIRKEIMEVVKHKKEELKSLSSDNQKSEMQIWLAENKDFLYLGKNANKALNKAKDNYLKDARTGKENENKDTENDKKDWKGDKKDWKGDKKDWKDDKKDWKGDKKDWKDDKKKSGSKGKNKNK